MLYFDTDPILQLVMDKFIIIEWFSLQFLVSLFCTRSRAWLTDTCGRISIFALVWCETFLFQITACCKCTSAQWRVSKCEGVPVRYVNTSARRVATDSIESANCCSNSALATTLSWTSTFLSESTPSRSMVTASSRWCRTSFPYCRCAWDFSVSFEIEIASSSPPATSSLPLPWRLPPSAATALLPPFDSADLLLLLGAPFALYCNCCLTYNYRVFDVVQEHASSTSMALSAYRTPRGTCTSLTTLARPTSREVDATKNVRLLPLLRSVFVSFVTGTRCHLRSNSSDSVVNFAPPLSLRQVFRQLLISSYPLHICSSWFGHLLQPQVFGFSTSDQSNRCGCVGVCPNPTHSVPSLSSSTAFRDLQPPPTPWMPWHAQESVDVSFEAALPRWNKSSTILLAQSSSHPDAAFLSPVELRFLHIDEHELHFVLALF